MASCTCANPQAVSSAIRAQSTEISGQIRGTGEFLDQTLSGQGGTDEAGGQGEHGRMDLVRFCHWAAPEISNEGERQWTDLWNAAALAIAIANGIAQGKISDMQMDLADRYYQMAKYKWDRFKDKYIPLEKQLLNETSTTPVRELDCADDRARAWESSQSAFDSCLSHLSRVAKKARICINPTILDRYEHKRTLAFVDSENYNIQDDQFFTDYKNDQRWNRRSNVLNLGRNNTTEALNYGNVARALASTVGSQIDQAANSLIGALGYYGARNDTYYPTTYLSGAGGAQNQMLVSTAVNSNINPVAMNNPVG